jgi:hypothetical protein
MSAAIRRVERVGGTIDPDQREAVAAGGRTHGADGLVAGENGAAPGSGAGPSSTTAWFGVRAVPRCCIRDTTSWPT